MEKVQGGNFYGKNHIILISMGGEKMITRRILKKGALLTLLFFICFTLTTHFSFAKDEDILLKARMLVKKGDFDGAIKELYEVIEKLKIIASQKRNLAEAYYLLARVYKIVQMESE